MNDGIIQTPRKIVVEIVGVFLCLPQKNHFGVSNVQKGYVGHPDDLLTSIFGFYAFLYVYMH